ncbi:MAG TPA: TetR/AcrR family transcriptional regulator [Solirubrobacterales bacterium]|nr:TetR/AcrR family transcriptional regulator [Solirubrobacterales bacterium]
MPGSPPADAAPERFEPSALADLPAELALGQLPGGRHGLPRSFVERNQRLRLIAAMLRVLPRHGYPQTTIGHVTQEAGVSRSAFYGQFASKEECFLATYDLAAEWLCERVEGAVAEGEQWSSGVGAGIAHALRLLAANPALAHLIAVEALQAGAAARRRRQSCIARLAEALRAGRPPGPDLHLDLEELLIGGALAHIARYVDAGRTERLSDATAELVQYLLIPYLDPAETRRIAGEAA